MVVFNNWFQLRRRTIYIYVSFLFRFPGDSENTIVTNYCILYAKQYIYLEKLKDKNKCLKHVLKIEENICSKNNEKLKVDKFNITYENL